jgi:N-acetylmuramoyl-L-alanine amidase
MIHRAVMPKMLHRNWLVPLLLIGASITPLATSLWISQTAIASPRVDLAQAPTRPTLRVGSTGSAVSELQAILILLDYFEGPVNGQFETSTEAAIKVFQADVGLTDDGVVGPATWEKLLPTPSTEFTPPEVPAETVATDDDPEAEEDPPIDLPTLRPGMTGPAVTQVQETLKSRNFYEGPIDGIFGPGTEAAVKAFQSSVGLADDGVVGPATWQALLQ